MLQRQLQARLDKLMLTRCKVGKIANIFPDDLAEDGRADYDVASGGDTIRMAEIILQETGERVVFDDTPVPNVIEIRTLDYGWA